jgi:hypothetical protein
MPASSYRGLVDADATWSRRPRMDTGRDRPPIEGEDNTEPTETMSGVGVPPGDGTIEGFGYKGEDEVALTDRENRRERPASDEPTTDTP